MPERALFPPALRAASGARKPGPIVQGGRTHKSEPAGSK
jgi:hypothetical protein